MVRHPAAGVGGGAGQPLVHPIPGHVRVPGPDQRGRARGQRGGEARPRSRGGVPAVPAHVDHVVRGRRDRHVRFLRAAGPQGSVRLGTAHREHARARRRLVGAGVETGVTRARDQDDVVAERVRDRGLQDRIAGRRRRSADPEGQVDYLRAVRDGVPDSGRRRPHRCRAGAAHDHRHDPGPRRDAHGAGARALPGDHCRHGRAVAVLADLDVGVTVAAGPGQVDTGQDHAAQVRDGGLDPAFHLGDGDAGALGQRPHLPLHLPAGEVLSRLPGTALAGPADRSSPHVASRPAVVATDSSRRCVVI